jgi:hypothetical protein
MRREDILAYLQRDRALVEEPRQEYWAALRREHGAIEGISIAEELRLHAIALHPAWPTADDRSADIENHARVSALLRRVRT